MRRCRSSILFISVFTPTTVPLCLSICWASTRNGISPSPSTHPMVSFIPCTEEWRHCTEKRKRRSRLSLRIPPGKEMMSMGARTVELDVRPYLRKKLEPFQLIMDTVKSLGPEDTFVLHATFNPTPLLGIMKMKGFAYKAEPLAKDHWRVTFVPRRRKKELEED